MHLILCGRHINVHVIVILIRIDSVLLLSDTGPGLENGFKKNLKTSKVQNLGFLGFLFFGQILYRSYLTSYFNRDL